jgi:hypothetical protein
MSEKTPAGLDVIWVPHSTSKHEEESRRREQAWIDSFAVPTCRARIVPNTSLGDPTVRTWRCSAPGCGDKIKEMTAVEVQHPDGVEYLHQGCEMYYERGSDMYIEPRGKLLFDPPGDPCG